MSSTSDETGTVGRPLNEYFRKSIETVTVYVGPKREVWILPEDLLRDKIKFFRSAFRRDFKEATTKEIHLEEDDPEAFGKIVDWVFTDSFECGCRRGCPAHCQVSWFNIYVLVDKWNLVDLEEHAALGLLDSFTNSKDSKGYQLSPMLVECVFEHPGNNSPWVAIRENMVEDAVMYFFSSGEKSLDEWIKATGHHPVFHSEVAKAIKSHHLQTKEDCAWRDNYNFRCDIHSKSTPTK